MTTYWIIWIRKSETSTFFWIIVGVRKKKQTMIALCSGFCDLGLLDSVQHYYPIRGRSYNPCDTDFHTAKRLIHKRDRIYTLKDFASLILGGSKYRNFQLTLVSTDMIRNYKDWTLVNYKKAAMTSLETQNARRSDKQFFKLQSFHYFSFRSNQPGVVVTKFLIQDTTSMTFNLRKLAVAQWSSVAAYASPPPITKKKDPNFSSF